MERLRLHDDDPKEPPKAKPTPVLATLAAWRKSMPLVTVSFRVFHGKANGHAQGSMREFNDPGQAITAARKDTNGVLYAVSIMGHTVMIPRKEWEKSQH